MLLSLSGILAFLLCVHSLPAANCTHKPRIIIQETAAERFPHAGPDPPGWIILSKQPDNVTTVGKTDLNFYNFRGLQKSHAAPKLQWEFCKDCKLTLVHQREEGKPLFVCGTSHLKTSCCDLTLSEQSPKCTFSENTERVRESISVFTLRENEHSVLAESKDTAELFVTNSGDLDNAGIHKFGGRVRPAKHDKEQHYVGLVHSKRAEPLQNRIYGFYKQKNKDTELYSSMWLPFVSQVCTVDVGGPKNHLQGTWTSLMFARLFCGDRETRQHFSELVDVAAVHADQWHDTRVYALFKNEWGMSAVCIYTIGDIDQVFQQSAFKGDKDNDRPRACVPDSTKISKNILTKIEQSSEMKKWVQPVNSSGPLLFNHHNYTHISAHASLSRGGSGPAMVFLSLNNGGVHKVMQSESHSFIIAEYRPFHSRTHILGLVFDRSSGKLYVNSEHELVQLDVSNCSRYGHTCQDCVLSRDPHCGWDGKSCTPVISGALQDLMWGNHTICPQTSLAVKRVHRNSIEDVVQVQLPRRSRYFLRCPVSSHHAHYTWHGPGNATSCSSRGEQCLLLIDGMDWAQEGDYKCVSEELGYSKVLTHYRLLLGDAAAVRTSSTLLWVCVVISVLMKSSVC
ncbi:semaphorin-7A-like isoform 1-T1 [Menidia menidia]